MFHECIQAVVFSFREKTKKIVRSSVTESPVVWVSATEGFSPVILEFKIDSVLFVASL